jgi:hypothetical protein
MMGDPFSKGLPLKVYSYIDIRRQVEIVIDSLGNMDAPDGGGTDHAVDARRRSAADEQGQFLMLRHVAKRFLNGCSCLD